MDTSGVCLRDCDYTEIILKSVFSILEHSIPNLGKIHPVARPPVLRPSTFQPLFPQALKRKETKFDYKGIAATKEVSNLILFYLFIIIYLPLQLPPTHYKHYWGHRLNTYLVLCTRAFEPYNDINT